MTARGRSDDSVRAVQQTDLTDRLAALSRLGPPELRAEWRRLYRFQPPRLSRDLMIRAVAYRMQELALGGLSKASTRKLAALAAALDKDGRLTPDTSPRIKPGTTLLREWRGRVHTVTATEDGYDYKGRTYASLTRIAREITGARWSGPRFFGLTRKHAANTECTKQSSERFDEDTNGS